MPHLGHSSLVRCAHCDVHYIIIVILFVLAVVLPLCYLFVDAGVLCSLQAASFLPCLLPSLLYCFLGGNKTSVSISFSLIIMAASFAIMELASFAKWSWIRLAPCYSKYTLCEAGRLSSHLLTLTVQR